MGLDDVVPKLTLVCTKGPKGCLVPASTQWLAALRLVVALLLLQCPGIIVFGATAASARGGRPAHRTDVLVVGTIHSAHRRNPNYSLKDVARILYRFNPQAICVEIRPQDFRRVPYLQEMMLATIFGLSERRSVYPIDWWRDTHPTAREVRESLSDVPFYQDKARQLRKLQSNDPLLREFESRFPDPYGAKLGYAFWNGGEYNDATAEAYRLSMQVYGDSCFNLYYATRNQKMLALVDTALGGHRGERVAVLTGTEHKHYFDRALARRDDVRVVDFASLLPLGDPPLAPAVAAFLDEGDDEPYFDAQALASMDLDAYYNGRLKWLLHAPDMDMFPEKVPDANLLPADRIVERWSKVAPDSPHLLFNRAWLAFLRGEFEHALDLYGQLCSAIDAHCVDDDVWVRVLGRLGFARVNDVMGRREQALAGYAQVERELTGTELEEDAAYFLQDYKTTPFQWRHSK
jgi:tetratricopeptide (TPR) repeat protein